MKLFCSPLLFLFFVRVFSKKGFPMTFQANYLGLRNLFTLSLKNGRPVETYLTTVEKVNTSKNIKGPPHYKSGTRQSFRANPIFGWYSVPTYRRNILECPFTAISQGHTCRRLPNLCRSFPKSLSCAKFCRIQTSADSTHH